MYFWSIEQTDRMSFAQINGFVKVGIHGLYVTVKRSMHGCAIKVHNSVPNPRFGQSA